MMNQREGKRGKKDGVGEGGGKEERLAEAIHSVSETTVSLLTPLHHPQRLKYSWILSSLHIYFLTDTCVSQIIRGGRSGERLASEVQVVVSREQEAEGCCTVSSWAHESKNARRKQFSLLRSDTRDLQDGSAGKDANWWLPWQPGFNLPTPKVEGEN